MTLILQTPDDVLEQLYREAAERADALGLTVAQAIADLDQDVAAELRAYIERVYG
jgi:hypothetical protein